MICFGLIMMFCELQQAPPVADTYCDIAKPIYWSPGDTRATKEQVDRENRKFKKLCRVQK